jgi:hypothetical protein
MLELLVLPALPERLAQLARRVIRATLVLLAQPEYRVLLAQMALTVFLAQRVQMVLRVL